jgi:hypothetical protein
LPEAKRVVIEDRLEFISGFGPDFVAIGHGGFQGYFVLGFVDKSMFVFESIFFGNASFVFRDDWEKISWLTKSEIIRDGKAFARIIHTHAWKHEMRQLLKQ